MSKINWYTIENEKKIKELLGDPAAVAIITRNKEGHTHVHAPWGDPTHVLRMINAFIVEAEKKGVIYKKPVEDRIGG